MATPTQQAPLKVELHRLIDEMSQDEIESVFEFLAARWEEDQLSPEEEEAVRESRAAFDRGEFVAGEDLERDLGL